MKNKSIKTVALMMAATVLSKLLGMFRSVLLGWHYGTSWQTDAFITASRIPLSLFDIFLSAAILGCFIPVYSGFKRDKLPDGTEKISDDADRFAMIFFNTVALFSGILTVVGIIFARPIVSVIGAGLDAQSYELAVRLLRIMFPMIIFTGTAFILVGVMQSRGSFILPAMISAISNAAVIFYFVFIDTALAENGIYGLAFAYLAAWFIQLVTLVIPLLKSGFKFRFLLDFKNPALRKALKTLPPIMVGSWLSPAGILIGTSFSTMLGSGHASVFDFANNIYVIISGILVYSICNYIFPSMSRLGSSGDDKAFNSLVSGSFVSAFMLMLPCVAAVLILSGEGVSVIFQNKHFDAESAGATSFALKLMSVGMPAYAIIELGSRVFYAKGKTAVPVVAAVTGVCADIIASVAFLYSGSAEKLGSAAFTLAFAIGQWAAALVIAFMLFKSCREVFCRTFTAKIAKTAVSAILCGALMALIYRLIGNSPFSAGLIRNVITAFAVFVPGAILYLILLTVFRLIDMPGFLQRIVRKKNTQG